ncbi:hypothetical protein EVAR_91721_1 [Eumeta japonica]|uniref:Uncharacterized protein n=1 Tax=Eumeta variegata TaxID=151549 RepID=A0A4C1SY82_EUMVA|nr:hypothetical protein EVAR_91721_1 [Eumeta japonica]
MYPRAPSESWGHDTQSWAGSLSYYCNPLTRSFACVDVEYVSSSFIWKGLVVNPNFVPAFNSGSDTGLDFEPGHALDFKSALTLGLDPDAVLDSASRPTFKFPEYRSRLQFVRSQNKC